MKNLKITSNVLIVIMVILIIVRLFLKLHLSPVQYQVSTVVSLVVIAAFILLELYIYIKKTKDNK
jgi:membrane protein implicated in regulation of membrane protease activity